MLNLQAGQEYNWVLFLSHVWHSTLVQTLCWILSWKHVPDCHINVTPQATDVYVV